MNITPREDFLISAFQDDPRLVEMFREAERQRASFRELLVEELIWWFKCGCVIAGTALAAYLVGAGLAVVSR